MARQVKRRDKDKRGHIPQTHNFTLWKLFKRGLIVYGIVVVAAILYYFQYYFTIRFGITSPTPKLVSEVLDKHVEFATTLLAQADTITLSFEALESDLRESKIRDVIQTIQNRVTSIRKQTSIYEKMERIPGGPKSFIDSSQKELDDILEQLYGVTEYNYIVQIEAHERLKVLEKELYAINTENLIFNKRKDVQEFFELVKIPFFIPATDREKEIMDKMDMKENLYWVEESLKSVSKLSRLYMKILDSREIREITDTDNMKNQEQIEDGNQIENENQEPEENDQKQNKNEVKDPPKAFKNFYNYKETHYDDIRLFYLSYHRLIQDIEESIRSFWKNVAKEGQNYVSDNLKNEIRKDCEDLKIRLKNLQH